MFNVSMFGKMYSILMVLSIKTKNIWGLYLGVVRFGTNNTEIFLFPIYEFHILVFIENKQKRTKYDDPFIYIIKYIWLYLGMINFMSKSSDKCIIF